MTFEEKNYRGKKWKKVKRLKNDEISLGFEPEQIKQADERC